MIFYDANEKGMWELTRTNNDNFEAASTSAKCSKKKGWK
jgi:hypothetical protein